MALGLMAALLLMLLPPTSPADLVKESLANDSSATSHTLAIKPNGSLWAWGKNNYGQLGLGNTTQATIPTQVGNNTNWKTAVAGGSHTIAIKTDGTLWAWGYNVMGQLGLGNSINKLIPTQVGSESNWQALSSGSYHTVALKTDGTLWAWGQNNNGQLGIGNNSNKLIPTQVGNSNNWMAVASGDYHNIALQNDGTLWAWGANNASQLGLGDTLTRNTPTKIGDSTDWKLVTAGNNHSFAMKTDGTMWAWGENTIGQLGLGDNVNRSTPAKIGNDNNWQTASAGGYHTLALKNDGTLWTWGENTNGQLGLGNTVNKNIPTKINNDIDWKKPVGGTLHSLAFKNNDTLWSWGYNGFGQLGLGDVAYRNTPTEIFNWRITYIISSNAGANGDISPKENVSVFYGDSQTFTITPNSGYSIADVVVDGFSVGAVNSYTFNNVTANHTISASFKIITYIINASAGTGGSISPSGEVIVNQETSQTFTIMPGINHPISDVIVDGNSVGIVNSYTFNNVSTGHTISANFKIATHTINASAGTGGIISPAGEVNINDGSSQTFNINPNIGYYILDVIVDESSMGAITEYTFENVTANHTISAIFEINTYTINTSTGTGGIISPAGEVNIDYGNSQTFIITPNFDHYISDVIVDGNSVGAVTEYTFENVIANHTISAKFKINTYTINANAEINGNISPSGEIIINQGSNQTFNITPNIGYHISDVTIDGNSMGAIAEYTFNNVTANHTISAKFKINTYTINANAAGTGGSILPSGEIIINHGNSQTFIITASIGYPILDVIVDGNSLGAITEYTFNNVTANHTISVNYTIDTKIITAIAGIGGSINPSGAISINYSDSQSFIITPNINYHINDVLVDGESVGAVSEYTFNNVTDNHTIEAKFGINTHIINASVGTGGSISPSGEIIIDHGNNQTFIITPSVGYHIFDVLIDGFSVGAINSYTFNNVIANHTISANFEINTYTINTSAGTGGSINPSGIINMNYGSNQTFNIMPNANYYILDVLVDSISVGAVNNYTFNNVTANHTISATFKILTIEISSFELAKKIKDYIQSLPLTAFKSSCYKNNDDNDREYKNHENKNSCENTRTALKNALLKQLEQIIKLIQKNKLWSAAVLTNHVIQKTDGCAKKGSPDSNDWIIKCEYQNVLYPDLLELINKLGGNYNDDHHDEDRHDGDHNGDNKDRHDKNQNEEKNNTYNITTSITGNGSITPKNPTVNYGGNQTFQIIPEKNYHIVNVLIDGTSVDSTNSYTFKNITKKHTISANFAIDINNKKKNK